MATTKITSPDLFNLESLNTALKLPSGTTAERPTSPSTGEWRYNTTTNLVEFYDGAEWRDLQSEDIPPIPSEHFNTVTWTGNGTSQSITGVGFQPDFVWGKERSNTSGNELLDSTRGATNYLTSNSNGQQGTSAQGLQSFDSDGFTVGNDGAWNQNGETYVAWCWKANGGTTSSNTDGSATSTVQVNTKAGFSIAQMTFAGTGSIGHGLGSTPELVILKGVSAAEDWQIYHSAVGSGKYLSFSRNGGTDAVTTRADSFSTVNSTIVTNEWAGASVDWIMYSFKSVAGYSSFGSYTGNGSTNGPIVNTGFEPAFLMTKQTNTSSNWVIVDNKRSTTNPRNKGLRPNTNDSESTVGDNMVVDFLTNGFQLKQTSGANDNGGTFIYIAFAATASTAPVLANSFTTNLYTGNGGTQILGTGFQPSLTWIKIRSTTNSHSWTDSVSGNDLVLQSNETAAQTTGQITLDSDGFTIGNGNALRNALADNYVAWSWKTNIVPTINTDGTIQSIVSANQAAGFSIVKYTGDGTSGSTVGHNLGTTPEVVIYKRVDSTASWIFKSTLLNTDDYLALNLTDQVFSDSGVFWNGTAPTSTVFTLGNSASVNASSGEYISYCFDSISGFSKFGTYTGNGSTQSITGLGFQPSWVLIKEMSASESWRVFDSARGATERLFPNTNGAESTASDSLTAFDSDGFSLGSSAGVNENTQTYIYMAFKNNRGFASTGTMAFTVVAGGGGGGASQGAGTQFQRTGCGGGAGGFRGSGDITGGRCAPQDNINLASGTYTVTVGAGGSPRVSGSASSIAGPSLTTISTVGGGRGGDDNNQPDNGGSGGGRSYYSSANGDSTACEGYGRTLEGLTVWQAGGGGAGGIQDGLYAALKSGIGVSSVMSGTNQFYAGGGAPGSSNTTRPQAAPGGGGNGQISGETAANTPAEITGTANTGGGGGGGSNNTTTGAKGDGGSGGSGIVILRLKTSQYSGTTTGSPTVTTDGDETIIQFTGSGTYVHS